MAPDAGYPGFLQSLTLQPVDYYSGPWCGHLPFGYDLVRDFQPQRIVELGAHRGQSYFGFCQAIRDGQLPATAFAIDTWAGDPHAGFYGEAIFERFAAVNDERFHPFSTMLRQTFDEALPTFVDDSIDLLHIDGLHTYDAVRHDFETWQSKLSRPALVLFHDTAVRERDFGVWKFWSEIRQHYRAFEFVHSNGLGILFVGEPDQFRSANGLVRALLDPSQHAAIRALYESVAVLFDRAHLFPSTLAERDRLLVQQREFKRELRFCRRFSLAYSLRRLVRRPQL